MRRAVQQENASYLYLQQTLLHPVALFIRSLSFLLFHHRPHSFRFYHVPRVVIASFGSSPPRQFIFLLSFSPFGEFGPPGGSVFLSSQLNYGSMKFYKISYKSDGTQLHEIFHR